VAAEPISPSRTGRGSLRPLLLVLCVLAGAWIAALALILIQLI
jgi:hypothetical protein